jgi:hypothetical protein
LPGEYEQNGTMVPNDSIKSLDENNRLIKLPIREFLKMKTDDNAPHYVAEGGNDNVKLPTAITIKSKEDRKDRDGDLVYPMYAYILADDYLADGADMSWPELKKGGLNKDNTYKPVQDYTVAIH